MPPAGFEPAIPASERVHTSALCRTVTAIRRCARCCCNVLPVLFADPPCCRFFSAHQSMLRHSATANSQPADSCMCPHQEQSSQLVRMRAVLSEPKPLSEQIHARLRCSRVLKSRLALRPLGHRDRRRRNPSKRAAKRWTLSLLLTYKCRENTLRRLY